MWSGGMRMVMGRPTASKGLYPKICSAPWFQLVMIPFKSLVMIASLDDSTTDAKKAAVSSSGCPEADPGCDCSPGRLSKPPDNERLLFDFRGILQIVAWNPSHKHGMGTPPCL